MPPTKEELTERAQLIRAYEGSCQIKYPKPEDDAFRGALSKKIAQSFGLKELRTMTLLEPAPALKPAPAPAPAARR